MLLSETINLFLGEQRETTRRSYFYVLRDMELYLGSNRPINEVAPRHLIEYAQHYRRKTHPHTGEPIRPATERKYATTAITFWNWCAKMRLIETSPATVIKRPTLQRHIGRDKAITDEELDRLLLYVRTGRVVGTRERDLAIIRFLADTGARAGGCVTIRIPHLQIEQRTGIVTEKGDKTRPVIFGDATAKALEAWLAVRPTAPTDHVFISRLGKPLTANYLGQVIRRHCQGAGIRTLSAHAFRHRKGHQMADNKIAPSIAATALGHSSSTITLEHYYPSDWDTAADALRSLTHEEEAPTDKIIRFRKAK
jgi:integrase